MAPKNMNISLLGDFDARISILKSDFHDSFDLVVFFNFPISDFHRKLKSMAPWLRTPPLRVGDVETMSRIRTYVAGRVS